MALIKWDSWREIEDMFDRYTRSMGWPPNGGQELVVKKDWSPRVDIAETEKEFSIELEIPGVEKEDVKVAVENGMLSIAGERKQEKEEEGKKFHRLERYYGSFQRSFTLPENVDKSNIKATFKDGLLNLEIPKIEAAQSKTLEIKVD